MTVRIYLKFIVLACALLLSVQCIPLRLIKPPTGVGTGELDGALWEIELSPSPSDKAGILTVISYNYAVIIDAGSSHTEMFIYRWNSEKINGSGIITEHAKMACQPVLSNFRENPHDAGPAMRECFNYATIQIPQANWNTTRVLLGATAGMRVLAANNETIARNILQSINEYVERNYYFITNPEDIAILSPDNEGGYAWLAINFIKGILQDNANLTSNKRLPTWGSMDLGGASTQFSVEVTSRYSPTFCAKVFGHEYKVYTKSFLCYGKDEAYRRYKAMLIKTSNFSEPIIDPCRPAQYGGTVQYADHFAKPCSNVSVAVVDYKEKYMVTGGGDGEACHRNVLELFRQTMDLNPSFCPFQDSPECAFAQNKKGSVRGRFLGTGALYYDTKNLNVLSNHSFSLDPFDAAGFREARNNFCAKSNEQVEKLISARPELRNFFIRHCFDATYEEVLLSTVYGLDDETLRDMVFAKSVNGVNVGWTLGWAVVAASDEPCNGDWKRRVAAEPASAFPAGK